MCDGPLTLKGLPSATQRRLLVSLRDAGMVGLQPQSLAGSSSFGMSGVNAHLLVARPSLQSNHVQSGQIWQQTQHRLMARPFHMLGHAHASAGYSCTFSCNLVSPSMSSLFDHRFSGTPVCPQAVMLEMATAAHATMLNGVEQQLLCGVTFMEPATLQAGDHSYSLHCQITLGNGICITSPNSAFRVLLRAWDLSRYHMLSRHERRVPAHPAIVLLTSTFASSAIQINSGGHVAHIANPRATSARVDGWLGCPWCNQAGLTIALRVAALGFKTSTQHILLGAMEAFSSLFNGRDSLSSSMLAVAPANTYARSARASQAVQGQVLLDGATVVINIARALFQERSMGQAASVAAPLGVIYHLEWQAADAQALATHSTPNEGVNCCRPLFIKYRTPSLMLSHFHCSSK